MDPATPSFSLSDVLALPEPTTEQETRVFSARGRDWPITISKGGLSSAESFFEIATAFNEAKKGGPLTLNLPTGEKLILRSPTYIASLVVLSMTAVSPKFSPEEWGIFGHKVGGTAMNDILLWAAEANGLDDEVNKKELADAGNASGVEDSTPPSSTPALTSSDSILDSHSEGGVEANSSTS